MIGRGPCHQIRIFLVSHKPGHPGGFTQPRIVENDVHLPFPALLGEGDRGAKSGSRTCRVLEYQGQDAHLAVGIGGSWRRARVARRRVGRYTGHVRPARIRRNDVRRGSGVVVLGNLDAVSRHQRSQSGLETLTDGPEFPSILPSIELEHDHRAFFRQPHCGELEQHAAGRIGNRRVRRRADSQGWLLTVDAEGTDHPVGSGRKND